MATVFKIHPAIGIARVGNSPDDFFIGPERLGEHPNPPGGFKDGQCRVKRQAARFRIFAHHDNGSVEEITNAEADITWNVHLVNKKAANPGRGNSESATDLTIDPGSRTLTGPSQRQAFDTGQVHFSGSSAVTVPLGEIRSDNDGHLLVLGGAGSAASPVGSGLGGFWANDDWYDDVADGPVTATVRIRADGSTPAVIGAWVIVAPPKFAPHQDSIITLQDRILDAMVLGGLVTNPTSTSYTRDVYPILQRARDTAWVQNTFGAHTWSDPVTSSGLRTAIFNRLRAPGGAGGDMPELNESTGDGRLTAVQYAHMERWKNGSFTNDWPGGPPAEEATVSPDGMDRAALEACVGGAFFPGIEGGGLDASSRPLLVASNYSEPFRLNHGALSPGDLTYVMALPWQADFFACADNWWPVPRPNDVFVPATSSIQDWDRGLGSYQDMVNSWHKQGFVVRQGTQYVEAERCDTANVTLLTPVLDFQDVPQGPMGMVREVALAITFEVIAPSAPVGISYAPGGAPTHSQLVAYNTSTSVGPTAANTSASAYLWLIYRTSNPGDVLPPQTLTLQDTAGGTFTVTVFGNTVARKTAATALVLDRSGSMSEDRGDGLSKHVSLQQAANIFVDVMLEGDGVGVVRFNQDAQVLESVVTLGSGGLSDVTRNDTKVIISGPGLAPDGATSIGDGIFEGRGILSSTGLPFAVKALVVLTDGVENQPRYIADVASSINESTYSIGLGQPQNISVPALQTISGNSGGYLLVTGPIDTNNRFRLQKYFLQILAGISNAEIVLDPQGTLVAGQVTRVPFRLTAEDSGVDVILLTPNTKLVDFRLQAPSGLILEPWRAMREPGMRYILSDGVTYYRIALPTELEANRFDQGGTWHALLTIGRPRQQPSDSADGVDRGMVRNMFRAAAPSVLTRARTAQMQRSVVQSAEHNLGVAVGAHASELQSRRTLPFSLLVHAYSNLSMRTSAQQNSFEPGAVATLHASLARSGIPLERGSASVWAEVTRPDATTGSIAFVEQGAGQFQASAALALPGVHQFRVRCQGTTIHGEPFTREQLLTAAVWRGGDHTTPPSSGGAHDMKLCKLLRCLLPEGRPAAELEARLRQWGIDPDRARKCIQEYCEGACKC